MRVKKIILVIFLVVSTMVVVGSLFAATKELEVTTYYPIPYGQYQEVHINKFGEGHDTTRAASTGEAVDWRVDGLNADFLDYYTAGDFVYQPYYDDRWPYAYTDCCYTNAFAVGAGCFEQALDPDGIFYPHCPSGYYVSSILHYGFTVVSVPYDPFLVRCCKLPTANIDEEPSWFPSLCYNNFSAVPLAIPCS